MRSRLLTVPLVADRVRLGAGRALQCAELMPGEAPPAVGDVLVLGRAWAGDGWSAVRIERVQGARVWFEHVSVRRGPLGASRWEFLPPMGWRAPERLRRR